MCFYKIDFSELCLNMLDFEGCSFVECCFKNCLLYGAGFKNCDLSGTDFSFSDMGGVDLRGAVLNDTNFFNSKIDNMISVGNLGEWGRTAYYFFKENRVICGCFDETLYKFEMSVRKKYRGDKMNYDKAIELFKIFRDKELGLDPLEL